MPGPVRIVFTLVAVAVSLPAGAQEQRLLGYQGRLLRADGTAATGTAGVTFAVFDAASGGTPLWSETQTLGLSDGFYSTFLGLVALPGDGVFDGGVRWLELRVGSETLLPRQPIGAVPRSLSAQSVRGGAADVTSLRVDGRLVVDPDGRLAGPARYAPGSGVAVDDGTQTISLRTCSAGQVLVHDATGWGCAGAITGVTAAGPLSAALAGTAAQLSLSQSGSGSNGYLSSTDWSAFNARYGAATQCGGDLAGPLSAPVVVRLQSRPVAAAAPSHGQVLRWNAPAGQWEPGEDRDSGGTVTGVTAHAPLTAYNGATVPDLSIAQASASADGYLSTADWSRFDAKYSASTQASGDLSGALGAPLVARLQGVSVSTAVPGAAQVMRFDGSRWAPASLEVADVGGLSSGYVDLAGMQTI